MFMMSRAQARRHAAGYALLEALIAVIVASVGFIGAARMQTFGMKLSSSAQWRQKATLLGYQMTDRIRANQLGADANAYDNLTTGGTNCLVATAGCATPTQAAVADFQEWAADVAAQLPQGRGVVCKDNSPEDGTVAAPACDGVGRVIAVKVWWSEKVSTTTDTATNANPPVTRFVTVVRTWRGEP
jgi:type IV pilus assembly protein PilV